MTKSDELWQRVGEAAGPVGEMTPLREMVRDCAWRITGADVAGLDADALFDRVLPVPLATPHDNGPRAYEATERG